MFKCIFRLEISIMLLGVKWTCTSGICTSMVNITITWHCTGRISIHLVKLTTTMCSSSSSYYRMILSGRGWQAILYRHYWAWGNPWTRQHWNMKKEQIQCNVNYCVGIIYIHMCIHVCTMCVYVCMAGSVVCMVQEHAMQLIHSSVCPNGTC